MLVGANFLERSRGMDQPINIADLNENEIEEILLDGDLSELEDEGCDGDGGVTETDDALIEAALAGEYDGDRYEEDDTSAAGETGQEETRQQETIASEQPIPSTNTGNHTKRTRWRHREEFNGQIQMRDEPNTEAGTRADWSTMNYFEQYITTETFMSFVNFTNLRYVQEKGRNLNVTLEEMKIFFGINLHMSVLRYPRLRMYWQKFTQVSTVTSKMSRDRFTQIRTNLKIVNDLDVSQDQRKADRLWKVRPFFTAIRDGCLKMIRPVRVCIDEQMIPFTGIVTNLKQFLRGKPNPEGMKNFVLATPEGLVLDFCVYQGKCTTFQTDCHLSLNVAEAVVMKLSESVPAGSCIYMDRYFTTEKLIDLLGEQEIACTGTVMRNKLPKCDFICDKDFSRLPRGTTEMFVSQDLEKVSVAVVKWNDNKPIYLMSSKKGKTPMDECRRWCKKQRKYIDVSRPNIVTSYNQYMGGVDMNDRLISYYRNFYKTKKWTLRIIMHFFTLAVVNAWVQYRNDRKILGRPKKEISDLMDFMMEISEHLTESGDKESSSEEELGEEQGPPPQKRKRLPPLPAWLKKGGHIMPEALEMKNPARCRRPGCSTGKSRIKCKRCDVFLCLTKDKNCYELFHQ